MQGLEALTRTCIPQTHCLIMTATGKDVPIGTKSNRPYPAAMPMQSLETVTSSHIPYLHRLIVTTAGNGRIGGAKGNRPHPVSMSL